MVSFGYHETKISHQRLSYHYLQIIMKYMPYYRVSTADQGKSGLGLATQRKIVHQFLKADDELSGEFIEVESGKRTN